MKRSIITLLFVLSTVSRGMDDRAVAGARNHSQKWDGEYYAEHSKQQLQGASLVIDKLKLSEYPTILDVGCGSGEITEKIARRAPKSFVLGVDLSESMIEEAKRLRSKSTTNLIFGCNDAESLYCPDEYRLVVSFAALHWMKNQPAAFSGMYEALQRGGELHFTMVADVDESDNWILKAFKGATEKDAWFEQLSGVNFESDQCLPQKAERVRAMLDDAGFKDVSVEQVIRNREFDSADKLAEWMFGWAGGFPALAALSSEERRAFIGDVAQCYAEITEPNDEGQVVYMLPTLIGSAKKG